MSLDRRSFVKLAGGGLILGLAPRCASSQRVRMENLAKADGHFAPNVFLSITPDNRVLVAMNKAEMGQGVMTGTAVLVAEELEVPLSMVEPFHAAKPEFEKPFQLTGGSTSTRENFLALRRAGASAREMLITAAANRWQVPRSDCRAEAGCVIGKDGRSITYGELTRDAAELDIPDDPPLKAPADFKLIGKVTRRVDALDKVTGRAQYGSDVEVEGVVRAYVLHPPVMGSPVAALDADAATKMPGVVGVFAFERGVAVLAEKFWQAEAAARTVQVTWGESELGRLDTNALMAAARERVKARGSHRVRDDGDVDEALDVEGATTIDVTYEAPYLSHAPMEPMNCTVWAKDGGAKVWAPNQSPTVVSEAVARVLGCDRTDVEVVTTMLGGGFGRRGVPDFAAEAAMIAKRTTRPVQLIWTRESDMAAGYYRPAAIARMQGALTKDGRVTAVSYHGLSQSMLIDVTPGLGALFPDWMPELAKQLMIKAGAGLVSSGSLPDILATEGMSGTPYLVDNVRVEYTPIRTKFPVSFWRSVGHSFNAFMNESFMDELAHAANADPFELRRDLLPEGSRHRAVLEAAARLGDWGKPIEEGWGRGIAVHESFKSFVAEVVEAGVVDGRIRVRRVSCVVDCGVAVNPDMVKAQMESGIIYGLSAALDQRIDMVDGVVQQTNFDSFPSLRMHESPDVRVEILPSEETPSGVGEPGLPPVAAGLANALFAATGVRLRRMPLQEAWDARESQS